MCKKYDYNLILSFPNGDAKAQKAVEDSANRLAIKYPRADRVTWDMDSLLPGFLESKYLSKLTDDSRLFIVSHGSLDGTLVADRRGMAMASDLVLGGHLKKVKRISIVACNAGWGYERLMAVGCFAGEFHRSLGKIYNVYTEVSARTGIVSVDSSGKKWVDRTYKIVEGKKIPGKYEHQAVGSKDIYTWVDKNIQKVI